MEGNVEKISFRLNLKHQWIVSSHHREESSEPALLVLHPSGKPLQHYLDFSTLFGYQRRCTVGTGQSRASGVTMSACNLEGLLREYLSTAEYTYATGCVKL